MHYPQKTRALCCAFSNPIDFKCLNIESILKSIRHGSNNIYRVCLYSIQYIHAHIRISKQPRFTSLTLHIYPYILSGGIVWKIFSVYCLQVDLVRIDFWISMAYKFFSLAFNGIYQYIDVVHEYISHCFGSRDSNYI